MPLYVYECQNGHREEVIRREAVRNEPYPCSDIGCYGVRMFRVGPQAEVQMRGRVYGHRRFEHMGVFAPAKTTSTRHRAGVPTTGRRP